MIEGLLEDIRSIEAATGYKPRRIELQKPEHCIKLHGVEIWGSAIQIGHIYLKLNTEQKITL